MKRRDFLKGTLGLSAIVPWLRRKEITLKPSPSIDIHRPQTEPLPAASSWSHNFDRGVILRRHPHSQEIFVVATTDGEAKSINDLNNPLANKIRQAKIKAAQERGPIEDKKIPISKLLM